jgi:penicillin-binding protein 1A
LVVDEPITIGGWSPANYGQAYLGEMTLERALAQSVNTVAVRLADEVGRDVVARTARRVGITSIVNTEPAMALGTTLVSPLEMAQAYAAFGNGGFRVQAYGVERIVGANGAVLHQARPPVPAAAIGNPALSDLNRMLRAVVTSGTGTRAAIQGYDIAGKTGTTSDYKDAWFVGYTGGLTTVVWMGRDDNAPLGATTGGTLPAALWRKVMATAVRRLPVQPIPYGPAAPPPPPLVDPIDAILAPLEPSRP